MPPIGFTTMRAFPGETHSMMISGGERPFTSGKSQKDQGQITYSRLTHQSNWKRLHLCTTFTILGSDVFSWSAFDLAFDIQAWDNSDRAHFRAQMVDNWEGDGALPLWKIARNDQATAGSGGYVTVPDSRPSMMGENENKGGWQFARLSVDLENTQAGATHGAESSPDTIGRYLELQCNDKVLDLTGIANVGQGWQDPQDPDPIGDYRGGCNPGVGGWRSTRNPNRQMNLLFGPTWVVVEK